MKNKNKLNTRSRRGFIDPASLALMSCAALGVFTFQHDKAIKSNSSQIVEVRQVAWQNQQDINLIGPVVAGSMQTLPYTATDKPSDWRNRILYPTGTPMN